MVNKNAFWFADMLVGKRISCGTGAPNTSGKRIRPPVGGPRGGDALSGATGATQRGVTRGAARGAADGAARLAVRRLCTPSPPLRRPPSSHPLPPPPRPPFPLSLSLPPSLPPWPYLTPRPLPGGPWPHLAASCQLVLPGRGARGEGRGGGGGAARLPATSGGAPRHLAGEVREGDREVVHAVGIMVATSVLRDADPQLVQATPARRPLVNWRRWGS